MEKERKDAGNIWSPKFSMFGLVVILFFLSLIAIRACMIGIPIGEVFRNQDAPPVTADTLARPQ
jgi:hypothetical protein